MSERERLVEEIAHVLNRHCAENASDTPDFILAEVALRAVEDFSAAVQRRERWVHGDSDSTGQRLLHPLLVDRIP